MTVLGYVLAQAEQAPECGAVCAWIAERTGSDLLGRLGGEFVPALLKILLILFLAVLANRVVRRAIKRFVRGLHAERVSRFGALRRRAPLADTTQTDLARATMRAETIGGVLRSVATFMIWTIALFMVLGTFDIQLGPLIAGAGIAGVALGFGAQSLVRDFLSGIFMLMEDQYGIGDIVDVGEASGTVEAVTLRTTRLRDVYGTVWYIPNGQIMRVGNKSQQWARTIVDVGVAYDTDIAFASTVIKRVADELWGDPDWAVIVIEEPEVWGVENFGPSEIVIRLVVKTVPGRQFEVNRELRARLKQAFDDEGIEIPFPQRTVWMRQAPDGQAQEDEVATPGVRGPGEAAAPDAGAPVTTPKQSGNGGDTTRP